MKQSHDRPAKLNIFAVLALALAAQEHHQAEEKGLLAMTTGMMAKHTGHGGRMAFAFDRRRAHLRAMKARRARGA